MRNSLSKEKSSRKILFFLFVIVVVLGFFFRSFNLAWGAPFFFHPDERNIAASISQLKYPSQMNPHFFAYGSLPIYTTYFTGVAENFISNVFSKNHQNSYIVDFEKAIIIGRSFSLLLSFLLIVLIYRTIKLLSNSTSAIIGTSLSLLSVGLIQYAHFATFEIWLSTFTLLLCFQLLSLYRNYSKMGLVNSGLITGLLLSIKISSIIFIPLVLVSMLAIHISKFKKTKVSLLTVEKIALSLVLFLSITTLTVLITSPYYWLASSEFISSMKYESEVALGTLPVFYTQIFQGTRPIIYQLIHVYPFLLNPFVFITLFLIPVFAIKRHTITKPLLLKLFIFFFLLVTFFSQAFLFVKWMRYYIPTLPFIYILLGILLGKLSSQKKDVRKIWVSFSILLVCISLVFSYAYFDSVLAKKDSRIAASEWAERNIPKNSTILSEVYDLGIVPFNTTFEKNITLFNFYDLETDQNKQRELSVLADKSEYVVLPSQRILQTRLFDNSHFPNGNKFYSSLIDSPNYKLIYKTPCSHLCKILYLGDTMFQYEQTANVFDRPEVYIFKHVN